MKPCACFIFFSWSVWLEAPSMHPAKSEDEDGKGWTPNRSGARDGMGSPASTTQTHQQHLGLAPELRPWRGGRWRPCPAGALGRLLFPAIHSQSTLSHSCLSPNTPKPNDREQTAPTLGVSLPVGSVSPVSLSARPQALSSGLWPCLSSLLPCPVMFLPVITPP